MRSIKSFRPQNQHPDALIQFRKEVAQRNEEAVRAAVQAMQRRHVASNEITVRAVARESGVSAPTIYRRDKLFALVQKANPELQRRDAEQGIRDDLARSKAESAEAVKEKDYHKKKAELVIIGSERLQQENIQLKKKILALQHENTRLKELVAGCTCESEIPRTL